MVLTVVVTTVVITLVLGLWPSVGVQVMIPLVSMLAPAGGLISSYTSGLAGTLPLMAVLVTTSVVKSLTHRLVCTGRINPTGASRVIVCTALALLPQASVAFQVRLMTWEPSGRILTVSL